MGGDVRIYKSQETRRAAAEHDALARWLAAPEFDLRLAAGLDFIASHSDNPFIGADDVAAAMGLGRRQAERIFHAAGLSIRRKLEETRLAHVKSILATTNRPLRSIAAECGFLSVIYLAGLFRKRFGTTPGAWRRSAAQPSPQDAATANEADGKGRAAR